MKRLVYFIWALAFPFFLMGGLAVWAVAEVNGVFLGADQGGVNPGEDLLRPGEHYDFPILLARDGNAQYQLKDSDLDGRRLTVQTIKGKEAIENVRLWQQNGGYYLSVDTAAEGITQEIAVEMRIRYAGEGDSFNGSVAMEVGYETADDPQLYSLGEGEFVTMSNDAPVLSEKQLEHLAEINGHQAVTFTGAGWRYEGVVAGMDSLNLTWDNSPIEEIAELFPEHQLAFLSFPALPEFGTSGKLTLEAEELMEGWPEQLYLYRYAYGELFPLAFEEDREAGTITFRPSQLSRYVLSDQPLEKEETPTGYNPQTGDASHLAAALLLGLLALAGAGWMLKKT